jgi:hypothetical protein
MTICNRNIWLRNMALILGKFKYTERNHPKEYEGDPCCLRHLLILGIWLDFYEDDMSPWILSSIHIQHLEYT